jgi:hypothetical protein
MGGNMKTCENLSVDENMIICEDHSVQEKMKVCEDYSILGNMETCKDHSVGGNMKTCKDHSVLENMKVRVNDTSLRKIFDREESARYFEYNISTDRPFEGPSHLVGQAFSGTGNVHEYIDDNDTLLHLLLTRFVSKLSKDQRIDFAFILELIMKLYRGSSKKPSDNK